MGASNHIDMHPQADRTFDPNSAYAPPLLVLSKSKQGYVKQ